MSIISEALKKVEGNSASSPSLKQGAARVELVDCFTKSSSPPLFSVWAIVLSTVMVLVAASLLFATWFMNRPQSSASGGVFPGPVSAPAEAVAAPTVDLSAEPAPAAPTEPRPSAGVGAAAPDAQPGPAEAVETPVEQVKTSPAKSTPPTEEPAPSVTSSSGPEPITEPEAEPEPAASGKRDELVLTGVVYTPRMRMAHINGRILPEGAKIDGYRIVSISRASVRLSKDEQFYILRLKR